MRMPIPLKIGIDFDNTLINYQDLFCSLAQTEGWLPAESHLSKEQVRALLVGQDGHDLRWQSLQAKAYGPQIIHAKLFPGFREFLDLASTQGHEVWIVSQKSVTSHYDTSVNLREWALQWLREQGLLDTFSDRIFFEPTRNEKIQRINSLHLDFFIDDLRDVLEDPIFSNLPTRVWFTSEESASPRTSFPMCSSWSEISKLVEIATAISGDAYRASYDLLGSKPVHSELVKGSGNNQIFSLHSADEKKIAVKKYYQNSPGDRDRCRAESDALEFLWKNGIRSIPQPLYKDLQSRFAVHSFINGKLLSSGEVNSTHIQQAADFLVQLQLLAQRHPHGAGINLGSDSRSCLMDYVDILERRLTRIQTGCNSASMGSEILDFLTFRFVPYFQIITENFYKKAAELVVSIDKPLPRKDKTLSPSDFGFHNALVSADGSLTFIDFEYFGWDDPAKMLADFFHTVAAPVSWKLKWQLLELFFKGTGENKFFMQRWELVIDLIGIEWILIVLNVADPEVIARKLFANPSLNQDELMKARLIKANEIMNSFEQYRGHRFMTIPDPS